MQYIDLSEIVPVVKTVSLGLVDTMVSHILSA